ncbi:MAG: DVUA0089 family protein [Rudaea sp.]|nr:DVUA0089 family protein [Rudaea sp.]
MSDVASAASTSWPGALALSAGVANDTATYEFSVSAAPAITIQSYGYGGSGGAPGGTNLTGVVIPAGGFDPSICVFVGAGPSATFLASNDDGARMPPSLNGSPCPDSALSLTLGRGTDALVVQAFDNLSLAENLGSGTLGDGFTGLGNYDLSRTNNFAIDIGGSFVDTLFANGLVE